MTRPSDVTAIRQWIGTPPHARAMQGIVAATGAVLRGGSGILDGAPDDIPLAACLAGVGPLLAIWIERGAVTATPDIAARLAQQLTSSRRRSEVLDARLREVEDAAAEHGITLARIKAAHTSNVWFPEPAARPASDVDVLVDPGLRQPVERLLRSLDYLPGSVHALPRRQDWWHRSAPREPRDVTDYASLPWSIDLHTSLDREVFPGCIARFGPVTHGTHQLDHPLLAAFLLVHCCERIRETQLIRLVECLLVLRDTDQSALTDFLAARRLLPFTLPALELVEQIVPGASDPALLSAARAAATSRLRHVARRLTPATVQGGVRNLQEHLAYARGAGQVLRALLWVAWPVHRRGDLRGVASAYQRRLSRLLAGRRRA